jgi:microcin C transport system permease protein
MGAYIVRRLLLIVPTLFGIMLINFTLTQFVPGGPIEQIIAQVEGGGDVFEGIAGGSDAGAPQEGGGDDRYLGARGLPQDFLDELEVEMGFARIVCDAGFEGEPTLEAEACEKEFIGIAERFFIMMGNYITLDFGESYFRSISVTELVNDGTSFDTWTSAIIIVAYAIPGFLFAILLLVLFAGGSYFQIFPLRGLVSDNWEELSLLGKIADYFWHITLPVAATTISAFATLTLLTKNSFLDEIKKQYVITAKAKGLSESRVLYGHVFRNAMLIVIAGFPSAFLGVFFGASIIIETIFSLDGLGRLGFEAAVARDYPVVFGTLFMFGLIGLIVGIVSDLMYVLVDPRIDFESRET